MVLAFAVAQREADGEGLNVVGLHSLGGRGLSGLRAGFRAGDVLGSGEGQQVSLIRGIEEICGFHFDNGTGIERPQLHAPDAVAGHFRLNGFVPQQEGQLPAAEVGLEHRFEHFETHPRLMRDAGDGTLPGLRNGVARASAVSGSGHGNTRTAFR